jgi:hypothetical protein
MPQSLACGDSRQGVARPLIVLQGQSAIAWLGARSRNEVYSVRFARAVR